MQSNPKKLSSAAAKIWPLEQNGVVFSGPESAKSALEQNGAISPQNGAVSGSRNLDQKALNFDWKIYLTSHMLMVDLLAQKDTLLQHYLQDWTWQVDGILSYELKMQVDEEDDK